MHPYLQTITLAATPVGELRLAIPFALAKLDLTIGQAYVLSVIGNLIPVVFWLLFLEVISKFLIKHSEFFRKFFDWL
ncbi:MAG: ligand-binding protein SH3, partial [Parcubacteria group bacterium CG_4_10_14_0_2_um_filter_41_6]